jgi:hypothetical protein
LIPKGKDQIKVLKYENMMKSYDAYFNLPEKGKYQVMILFKVGDQKRTGGILRTEINCLWVKVRKPGWQGVKGGYGKKIYRRIT